MGADLPGRSPGLARLRAAWAGVTGGLEEFYRAPYRRTMARARRDEEDLFMMLVMSEALGVPSPASAATLELLPQMLERLHEWHRREGLDSSPFDTLACC